MNPRTRLTAALTAGAVLSACTSLRVQDDWPRSVEAGDQVRIWKLPSGAVDMTVTAVSADAIEGVGVGSAEPDRIDAAEIRRVERRQVDGFKIVKGIGIGLFAALSTLLAAFLIAFG